MTNEQLEQWIDRPANKQAKEIWNAALEKAAKKCDEVLECKAAARIRELKK